MNKKEREILTEIKQMVDEEIEESKADKFCGTYEWKWETAIPISIKEKNREERKGRNEKNNNTFNNDFIDFKLCNS